MGRRTLREQAWLMTRYKVLLRFPHRRQRHGDFPQMHASGFIRWVGTESLGTKSGGRLYYGGTSEVYSGVAVDFPLRAHLEVDFSEFWTGTSPEITCSSPRLNQGDEQATIRRGWPRA